MSQANWMLEETVDRGQEIAEARAQLIELAAQQGVSPVNDPSDLKGSPAPNDSGNDDVDELLRLLRQWHQEDLSEGE
ncbi:MAG TPA: hypothetical protein VK475_09840 [Pyrinomonadaceae bacterium]|nr:hypothetical protein [Pyrinomonadaceae bacterium]